MGVSGRCCVVFEAFRLCLNVGLCGVNDSLQVLCCLGVSGTARHALYSFDTIGQCVHHFVGAGDGGIGDVLVLELNGVG